MALAGEWLLLLQKRGNPYRQPLRNDYSGTSLLRPPKTLGNAL